VQTTARKRKSLTATKARESNSRKGNFVDFCVEHSLFYAGSKFMLGFEEREDDEEEEEEDGGAWWIALLTCYLIGCDADTAPEELRPRLLQKKLVIIVICHRHSECRFLQPSGRRSACGGNRKRFDREELFVTGIFPCQEEHGRRRSSSKLLLGLLQLLSRQTDECFWMSKGGV